MIARRMRAALLIFGLLVGMLVVTGGSLVQANHSPGTTVFVDDDCTAPGDGSAGNPFCTIQDGIQHANPGDTVDVAAGTYVEEGQLVIDKDLTIVGAGIGSTVVMTDSNTSNNGDGRGWFLVQAGVEFHLSGLTLDGSGHLVWQAIRHLGSGTVDSVRFINIRYQVSGSPYAGTGIAAFGNGMVHVFNSEFDQVGRIGLQYFGAGVSGSVADGNSFQGKGPGDWLDYGIEISAGAEVTATNNTISNNRGVAGTDGSASAAFLVTTFFGPGTTALIENNDISDNTTGIAVGFDGSDTSTVEAHNNNITGNDTGISTTAPVVDATCNWWGDESGPFNATANPDGAGNPVDDDVDFEPWLTGEAPEGDCNGPLPSNPETKEDCKNGGWEQYGFKNQGQCIRYVETGQDSREE